MLHYQTNFSVCFFDKIAAKILFNIYQKNPQHEKSPSLQTNERREYNSCKNAVGWHDLEQHTLCV